MQSNYPSRHSFCTVCLVLKVSLHVYVDTTEVL